MAYGFDCFYLFPKPLITIFFLEKMETNTMSCYYVIKLLKILFFGRINLTGFPLSFALVIGEPKINLGTEAYFLAPLIDLSILSCGISLSEWPYIFIIVFSYRKVSTR